MEQIEDIFNETWQKNASERETTPHKQQHLVPFNNFNKIPAQVVKKRKQESINQDDRPMAFRYDNEIEPKISFDIILTDGHTYKYQSSP